MKKVALALGLMLASGIANAGSPVQVSQTPVSKKVVRISSEPNAPESITVVARKKMTKYDCNHMTYSIQAARISGDGQGYYDQYYVQESVMQTEMYCPQTPSEVIVESKPMTFKSLKTSRGQILNIDLIVDADTDLVVQ